MSLLEHLFRANPRLELVVFERLSPPESEPLRSAFRGGTAYGILRDLEHPLQLQVIDPDVALLFLTLATPMPIPTYARRILGGQSEHTLLRLLLDGVLEVADESGRFVSGQQALAFCQTRQRTTLSRVAQLSENAVHWAADLGFEDPNQLAAALYWFNSVPVAPELEQDSGWSERIRNLPALEAGWKASLSSPEWCMCSPRQHRAAENSELMYKLYVSVLGEDVIFAVEALCEALRERGLVPFKFGAHLRALHRPDKVVAYFRSLGELQGLARELAPRLGGLRPQGVPFSAPIDAEGRLSWGIDPPGMSDEGDQQSWRYRVVSSLGHALSAALAHQDLGSDPCEFALQRAALDGIDLDTFTPLGSLLLAEGRN